MTCANWTISILSVVIIAFSMLSILSVSTSQWITAISALLILIVAWTGCKCSWCFKANNRADKSDIKVKRRR